MVHIFLDIDGVLNKESDWSLKYHVDKNCVKILKLLIESIKDEVSIVLTSTWKNGYSKDGNHSPQIIKVLEHLREQGLDIDDITPITTKGRQEEIEYYIRRNLVKKYIVLDDDISLFSQPKNIKIYIVDYKKGLTTGDVKKIIKYIK